MYERAGKGGFVDGIKQRETKLWAKTYRKKTLLHIVGNNEIQCFILKNNSTTHYKNKNT